MKIKMYLILLLLGLNISTILSAETVGFGMLMDAEGLVLTRKRGLPIKIEIGDIIPFGTKIQLATNSSAIITTFSNCQEWELNGAGEYLTSREGFVQKVGNSPILSRQLPVCFDPEEFADVGGAIGGLSSRRITPHYSHPLEPFWREAATGQARNSTLMVIILDGIKTKNIARVRPYFEILKQRIPHAVFITKLNHYFL